MSFSGDTTHFGQANDAKHRVRTASNNTFGFSYGKAFNSYLPTDGRRRSTFSGPCESGSQATAPAGAPSTNGGILLTPSAEAVAYQQVASTLLQASPSTIASSFTSSPTVYSTSGVPSPSTNTRPPAVNSSGNQVEEKKSSRVLPRRQTPSVSLSLPPEINASNDVEADCCTATQRPPRRAMLVLKGSGADTISKREEGLARSRDENQQESSNLPSLVYLDRSATVLGRSRDCDILVKSSHFPEMVSRHHATIKKINATPDGHKRKTRRRVGSRGQAMACLHSPASPAVSSSSHPSVDSSEEGYDGANDNSGDPEGERSRAHEAREPTMDPQEDEEQSREHASWFVVDLNSLNGTFVNGVRVRRAQLYHGDVITLGGGGAHVPFGQAANCLRNGISFRYLIEETKEDEVQHCGENDGSGSNSSPSASPSLQSPLWLLPEETMTYLYQEGALKEQLQEKSRRVRERAANAVPIEHSPASVGPSINARRRRHRSLPSASRDAGLLSPSVSSAFASTQQIQRQGRGERGEAIYSGRTPKPGNSPNLHNVVLVDNEQIFGSRNATPSGRNESDREDELLYLFSPSVSRGGDSSGRSTIVLYPDTDTDSVALGSLLNADPFSPSSTFRRDVDSDESEGMRGQNRDRQQPHLARSAVLASMPSTPVPTSLISDELLSALTSPTASHLPANLSVSGREQAQEVTSLEDIRQAGESVSRSRSLSSPQQQDQVNERADQDHELTNSTPTEILEVKAATEQSIPEKEKCNTKDATSEEATHTLTKMEEDIASDLTCPICWDTLVIPSLLTCSHTFCNHCIRKWMSRNLYCPECRSGITGAPIENRSLGKVLLRLMAKDAEWKERYETQISAQDMEKKVARELEKKIASAKAAGHTFLDISDYWSAHERHVFRQGLSRFRGTARTVWCESVGLTMDFVENQTLPALQIAALNVGLNNSASAAEPSAAAPLEPQGTTTTAGTVLVFPTWPEGGGNITLFPSQSSTVAFPPSASVTRSDTSSTTRREVRQDNVSSLWREAQPQRATNTRATTNVTATVNQATPTTAGSGSAAAGGLNETLRTRLKTFIGC